MKPNYAHWIGSGKQGYASSWSMLKEVLFGDHTKPKTEKYLLSRWANLNQNMPVAFKACPTSSAMVSAFQLVLSVLISHVELTLDDLWLFNLKKQCTKRVVNVIKASKRHSQEGMD